MCCPLRDTSWTQADNTHHSTTHSMESSIHLQATKQSPQCSTQCTTQLWRPIKINNHFQFSNLIPFPLCTELMSTMELLNVHHMLFGRLANTGQPSVMSTSKPDTPMLETSVTNQAWTWDRNTSASELTGFNTSHTAVTTLTLSEEECSVNAEVYSLTTPSSASNASKTTLRTTPIDFLLRRMDKKPRKTDKKPKRTSRQTKSLRMSPLRSTLVKPVTLKTGTLMTTPWCKWWCFQMTMKKMTTRK